MTRLVTFGCSYTQGIGLSPDMANPSTKEKSPLAWPQVTADLLGIECANMSEGGCSPKKVAYTITNFDFRPDDIVVVMWPSRSRYVIIGDPDTEWNDGMMQISIQDTLKEPMYRMPHHDSLRHATSYYQDCYTETDSNFMFKAWITLADTVVKSQGAKIYHTSTATDGDVFPRITEQEWKADALPNSAPKIDPSEAFSNLFPEFNWVESFTGDKCQFPPGMAPCGHWSADTHRDYGNRLSKILQENISCG